MKSQRSCEPNSANGLNNSGVDAYPADAWDLLASSLTPQRQERMLRAAAGRTRRVRLVVQDVHQPHNISACMRSAEAFGVQDVDVVIMSQRFRPSTAARGVEDWLTIRRHRDVASCVAGLRQAGYALVAGVPSSEAVSLYDLPVDQPLAVIFGNEHDGIHADWRPHIDHAFTIPMAGIVESLNISVSAAITLAHLTRQARLKLGDAQYHLPQVAQNAILCEWVCKQLHSYDERLRRLREGD